MSQHDMTIDTTFGTDVQNALQALVTVSKGSSAPSTSYTGQMWLDDTSTPWLLKIFDGTDWFTLGEVDATTNSFTVKHESGGLEFDASGVADGDIIVGTGAGTMGLESGATARASLGLAIGSDVQAYDADTAKLDTAQEWTAMQNFNATTLTDGANISWDVSANQVTSVTLAGNRTLDNPTNMQDGATFVLTAKQDGTGSRTLSYGAAYKWPGGVAPTLSTGANDIDILTFVSDGTSMFGVIQQDFS
ncbi:MAG TPA: hypothetical protein QF630_04600 [Alphaproteobacteria bacterium]|jgi:hypothetical protein|nr:hypothetical protein [Alphaproteobacteria bacterium]